MIWQWFHQLGSPRWFYQKTGRWMPWLVLATATLFIAGTVWGLGYAPVDSKQGNSYRILYIHVPAALLALAGYYVMAVAGAVGIIWQMKLAYIVMRSAAPVGAVLTFIALFTGAVWGKPTWGTWWEWDARITSMLILFFLYLGIMALQSAYQRQQTANTACAILALVGTINIPVIYKSVDWWLTLHQPATLKLIGTSSIHPSMAYPLMMMIVAFYGLYTCLLIHWTRAEILHSEQKTAWVKSLLLKP